MEALAERVKKTLLSGEKLDKAAQVIGLWLQEKPKGPKKPG